MASSSPWCRWVGQASFSGCARGARGWRAGGSFEGVTGCVGGLSMHGLPRLFMSLAPVRQPPTWQISGPGMP